jgi:ComF family protein
MSDPSGLPGGASSDDSTPTGRWNLRLLARQLADTALDFLFPARCVGCQRAGSLLCDRCQSTIRVPDPMKEAGSPLAERRTTAEFDGTIRKAIHALKYQGQRRMAVPLSQRLLAQLRQSDWQPTLITAAPMHEGRLRERGYNQAALLAAPLAQAAGIPFHDKVLQRVRETRTQVGLNAQERQDNVADAFLADSSLAKGQQIVIVDDVYTTGATLRECASALLDAGAVKVWALTVAKAAHNKDTIDII